MADQILDTTAPPIEGAQPIVVLLVDDQAFVGNALGMLLASEPDIDLHCCLWPVNAIALATEIVPMLILVDIIMPDLDGVTLVRCFRSNPQTAGTPIIMLSANDDADSRARALAAGADDFLVKLPQKPALIASLRHQASRSAVGKETLDSAVLDKFREAGAPAFMQRLIDQFLLEGRARVEILKAAADRADRPALKAAAHNLKGSSSMMGALRLASLCGQVEGQATEALGGEITPALIAAIDQELVRVDQAFAAQRAPVHP
jgi:DNA-binding response OmpR family regulator